MKFRLMSKNLHLIGRYSFIKNEIYPWNKVAEDHELKKGITQSPDHYLMNTLFTFPLE